MFKFLAADYALALGELYQGKYHYLLADIKGAEVHIIGKGLISVSELLVELPQNTIILAALQDGVNLSYFNVPKNQSSSEHNLQIIDYLKNEITYDHNSYTSYYFLINSNKTIATYAILLVRNETYLELMSKLRPLPSSNIILKYAQLEYGILLQRTMKEHSDICFMISNSEQQDYSYYHYLNHELIDSNSASLEQIKKVHPKTSLIVDGHHEATNSSTIEIINLGDLTREYVLPATLISNYATT